MIFGVLNSEKIWHQLLVHLATSPVYCSHFTLGNQKLFFNSTICTYFRLFALSQKKTNCYSLTHHIWKMLPHYVVKCANFFIFFNFSDVSTTNPQYGRVAEASWCDMGWISAERGGRCSWSGAKKTGSMCPCKRWSLWTFPLTLLAWHPICHTLQPVLFRATKCQPTTGFFQSHQRLEEFNIPSVRWKSCAFYQVVQ